jgi:hypothetical protein
MQMFRHKSLLLFLCLFPVFKRALINPSVPSYSLDFTDFDCIPAHFN